MGVQPCSNIGEGTGTHGTVDGLRLTPVLPRWAEVLPLACYTSLFISGPGLSSRFLQLTHRRFPLFLANGGTQVEELGQGSAQIPPPGSRGLLGLQPQTSNVIFTEEE